MRAKTRRTLRFHLELNRRQCLAVMVAVLLFATAANLLSSDKFYYLLFPAPNGNYALMTVTGAANLASVGGNVSLVSGGGSVGIGPGTPVQTLDVNGTAQLRGSAGGSGLSVDGNGNVTIGGSGSFTLGSAAADWGPPYPPAGTMYFNTTYKTIRMFDGNQDAYGWVPVTSGRRQFVTACYNRFLGRSPDIAGLSSWLQSGMGYLDISIGFAGSAEFRTDYPTPKGFVDQLYKAYLGRTPGAGPPAEDAGWVAIVAANDDLANQTRMAVARGFATSPECRSTSNPSVCFSMRY